MQSWMALLFPTQPTRKQDGKRFLCASWRSGAHLGHVYVTRKMDTMSHFSRWNRRHRALLRHSQRSIGGRCYHESEFIRLF
jgi:hypothetical protein